MADAKIVITAETQQAQAAIANLNRSLGSIDRATGQANKSLAGLANTSNMLVGALAAVTAGLGVREIIDYTARWTDLNSRLVNATGSQEAAKQALDAISVSARTTFSSLEETAKVFVRNSMAMNELGYTTNEQIKLTEALNNGIAVSGARGVEAASALDAFAQAIARGKMEGEDFNRLIENSPRIVKALADGLGVTTGEFRRMITEGEITTDVMIPALLSQMEKLKAEAEAMPATVSDAFVVLTNSLFETIGRMDEALGISQALAGAMLVIADNIELLIGAVAALTVAAGALLVPLLPAVAALGLLAAKIVAIAALGAGIAYIAKQMGFFGKKTSEAVDPAKEAAKAAEDAAAALQRQADAAKRLLEQQTNGIRPLLEKINAEKESLGLNQEELAIKKSLSEAAKTLKIEEDKLLDSVRQQIVESTKALVQSQQEFEITKTIVDLETERLGLSIQDKNQREIALAIRKFELNFGRELNETEKQRLTNAIQLTQAAREQEASMKRQLQISSEQAAFVRQSLEQDAPLQAAVNNLDLYYQALQDGANKTFAEINEAYERSLLNEENARQRAHDARVYGVKREIAAIIGQEDELFKIKLDYANREAEIRDAIRASTILKAKTGDEDYLRFVQELNNQLVALEQQKNIELLSANEQRIRKQMELEQGLQGFRQGMSNSETLQTIGNNERIKGIVNERIAFEKKSELEKAQFAMQQGANIFNSLGTYNKKAFEAAKAFNIANAVMNTYMGATKALATYPPPFNFIAAAAVVAAGLAQVASIRSQSYSGRQLGGPVMNGTSYIVGENGPEMFTPTTNGSITRNGDLNTGGAVTVNFNITANDAAGFDDLLLQRKGMITQMISDAMVDRGQRSML